MIDDVPRPRPPFLHSELTRHGSRVWYVRRGKGPRTRLRAAYDGEDFWQEYRAAIEGRPRSPQTAKGGSLSFRAAIDRYRKSSAWGALSNATRRQRENIYRRTIATAGDEPLTAITEEAIRRGREIRQERPHAANNFIKAMRSLFAFLLEERIVASNPATAVKLLKGPNDDIGFHTWTPDELDRFEDAWPIGSRERLAFDLLIYTGLRRGDAVKVGRQHVRDGIINIKAEKTGEDLYLPILDPLAKSIGATRTGDLAFLCNAYGEPWVKESFGNWFKEVCRATGCPGSAHGLRKAGATRAAERGATDRQLMAIFGWNSPRMSAHYTRAADRKRLATQAAELLLPERRTNENARTERSGAGASTKSPKKSIR